MRKTPYFKSRCQHYTSTWNAIFARARISHGKKVFSPTSNGIILSPQIHHAEEASSSDGQQKANNSLLPYAQLNEHRHSVREFSDEPVDVNLIEQATDMAMRTPSVCNRQPTRVHLILNPEIITKALAIQGGVGGYAAPPALILITSDLRSFITSYERNEGFTDGGLFGMSLLLSLESLGLASCPLNTMFTAKADKDTRKLLNLPDNEVPVMYIEVGNFLEETRTCASVRYTGNQITTVIK